MTISLLLGVALFGLGDSPSSHLAEIGPAPAVRLIDGESKPFDLESTRGKCVLVGFVFTTCNGTCPLTTSTMARTRDLLEKEALWGRSAEFVSISLDPKHDQPDVLRKYAAIYHADPRAWHFLTGPVETVDRVVSSWGMWAKRTELGVLDHPSRIFLLDPKGKIREIYNLESLKPEVVVSDIRALIGEANGQ